MRDKSMFSVKIWGLFFFALLPYGTRAGVIVSNGLSHHHKVTTGNVYKGSIELQNTINQAQTIRVYQRDYRFNYIGEATYDLPGSDIRSNAKWIDISPKQLVLKGMEKSVIKYEINIPVAAGALKGTYWSVIMVEGLNPVDTAVQKGFNVNTVVRYAVQISTSFGESGTANLKFLNVKLKKEDQKNYLQVDVENDGERYLLTEMVLEFFNNEGISAGVYKSEPRTTYPGTSTSFNIPIGTTAAGHYKALLVANCSEDDVFGLNLTLDIKDD